MKPLAERVAAEAPRLDDLRGGWLNQSSPGYAHPRNSKNGPISKSESQASSTAQYVHSSMHEGHAQADQGETRSVAAPTNH